MNIIKNTLKVLAVIGSFALAGLLIIGNGIMNVIGLIIGAVSDN